MFKKASEQKDATIVNVLSRIEKRIESATKDGMNQTRIDESEYYMGPEVISVLKEAGYHIEKYRSPETGKVRHTIYW